MRAKYPGAPYLADGDSAAWDAVLIMEMPHDFHNGEHL